MGGCVGVLATSGLPWRWGAPGGPRGPSTPEGGKQLAPPANPGTGGQRTTPQPRHKPRPPLTLHQLHLLELERDAVAAGEDVERPAGLREQVEVQLQPHPCHRSCRRRRHHHPAPAPPAGRGCPGSSRGGGGAVPGRTRGFPPPRPPLPYRLRPRSGASSAQRDRGAEQDRSRVGRAAAGGCTGRGLRRFSRAKFQPGSAVSCLKLGLGLVTALNCLTRRKTKARVMGVGAQEVDTCFADGSSQLLQKRTFFSATPTPAQAPVLCKNCSSHTVGSHTLLHCYKTPHCSYLYKTQPPFLTPNPPRLPALRFAPTMYY